MANDKKNVSEEATSILRPETKERSSHVKGLRVKNVPGIGTLTEEMEGARSPGSSRWPG
jgi:hypothetical protein